MKFKHFTSGIAALLLMGNALNLQAQEISAMQAPKVVSPEIAGDNSVTFRVLSGKAN